jgi:molybdopterin molybdotransferase
MSGIRERVPSLLLADALAAIRTEFSPVHDLETIPLSRAQGRVLADALISHVDLPFADLSAVDGFAVRDADVVAGARVRLRLIGEASAGHPYFGAIGRGQAIRILTGAIVPEGADRVIMQELCTADGDVLTFLGAAGKTHCRRRGEDVHRGAQVLEAGHRLLAQDIAIAGALGCSTLGVLRQLRVGLFSTGDELREPGAPLGRGQIWDANRCLLRGLLERMGCEVQDCGILRDDPRDMEVALSAAAHECDLLVTSGGMSVGREDHVRSIIGRRGTLDIWPVAIKPGRPVGLGDIDTCPILALPGNPIAAVVAFAALGRSIVNVLSGAVDATPALLSLPAGFAFEKETGVRQFLLAELRRGDGYVTVAVPCERQGTAMLSTLGATSGFIVFVEDRSLVRHGSPVEFLPMSTLLH